MRIIAGTYRSRVLKSFRGLKLRPTSDQLRETLFNILGPLTAGSRFVDVYAGTGAVGIEALSRGAAEVIFIEKHAPAANLIRRNLESLGVAAGATVLAVDALRGLEMLRARRDANSEDVPEIFFFDPPYAKGKEYDRMASFLGASLFLAPGTYVVVEHSRGFALPETFGRLRRMRLLKQGDAALSFYSSE